MQHVGPGTLIGDRYAVSHRLQQHPRWERWAAHDTTLGRDVVILTLYCVPENVANVRGDRASARAGARHRHPADHRRSGSE